MYHVIINPSSRSGRGRRIWEEQVEPALKKSGSPYRPYFSEQAGDTVRIVRELFAREQGDISLIVLGGDGTVNEALQEMEDTSRVILGYIPTGSSNDMARDLKLPKKPLKALDVILRSGSVCPMDLGTVHFPDGETRRFAVSCGIGFDAAVCEEALHSRVKGILNKLGLGKLTYLGVALGQLFAAKATSGRLTLEGGKPIDIGNMLFTACMLHRYEGGGFMFAPDADACDGILNLCAVGDLPKLLILFALPTAFFGKHYMVRGITPYQSADLTIETRLPLWVHTDGEVSRKSDRIRVTCEKGAIRVIRPR